MTKPKAQSDDPVSFEAALTELEAIVSVLEEGNLPLDASVERFRKASELADHCRALITGARLRVTELQTAPSFTTTDIGAGDDVPF